MKKTAILISALSLLLGMTSCKQELGQDNFGLEKHTYTCTIDCEDSKVAIDDAGKVTWAEGDVICVHNGAKTYELITLTSADITNDGKTATITTTVTEDASKAGLFASYPGEALPSGWSSSYDYCFVSNSNNPIIVGPLSNGEFLMKNAEGAVTFSVTGDFDTYEFYGNNDEVIGYDGICLRGKKDYEGKVYTDRCGGAIKKITGNVSDGKMSIFVTTTNNGLNLSSGFTFKFFKGEECVKVATSTAGVTIGRNQILALGDITSHLKDYVAPTKPADEPIFTGGTDLSATECANCYIIAAPGNYTFKAVKGNDATAALEGCWNAEILWETYGNDTEVVKNSVVAKTAYTDGKIQVQMPAEFHKGNALIAVKDATGKILWSWHIWATDNAISGSKYGDEAATLELMNYNLGATGEVGTAESFGLQYQWGRKDPFIGSGVVGTSPAFAKVNGASMETTTKRFTDGQANQNPTTLYLIPGSAPEGETGDSIKDWLTPSDNGRWNTVKTINDPCPAGWRVPNSADNALLNNSDTDKITLDKDAGIFTFNGFSFPYAAYISYSSGNLSAGECFYHSADPHNVFSSDALRVNSKKKAETRKATPGAVRCVKVSD